MSNGEYDPNDPESFGPPLVADFGFNHSEDRAEYVRKTVEFLELSNWQCWPEWGGWANQDAGLVDDVFLFLKIRRRIAWEVEHNIGEGAQTIPDNLPALKLG